MKEDLAILAYESNEVFFFKYEPKEVEERFQNNIEEYIRRRLGFPLGSISYMCSTKMYVNMVNGAPGGGVSIGADPEREER